MSELVYEYESVKYTATYQVIDDELIVYLPNGEERRTMLRGLTPELAAKTHLVAYVKKIAKT